MMCNQRKYVCHHWACKPLFLFIAAYTFKTNSKIGASLDLFHWECTAILGLGPILVHFLLSTYLGLGPLL
ncbi:hypothetical protein VNO77_21500 [Canavalia gladiata]|uniref:Uncharacterized protein n=1 Tax=Canavalia gladiata TaxID=3824 RepID=A0AAN9QMC8_CANGL